MTNLKPSKDIKFYDASAIIKAGPKLLKEKQIMISREMIKDVFSEKKYLKFITLIKRNWGLFWLIRYAKRAKDDSAIILVKGQFDNEIEAAKYANDYHYIDEVIYVTADKKLAKAANKYFGDQMIELI